MAQDEITDSHAFGARLALALKAINMSRSQLAAAMNVDKSVVSRWLSGQITPASHNLARISALFAKHKPGFNMTLWTAPPGEFEAALGLAPGSAPAAAAPRREPREADIAAAILSAPHHLGRYGLYATAGLVVLLVAAGAWHWLSNDRPSMPPAARAADASVAVMPFVNMSGDPAKEYLGDGIAEEVTNDLANTPDLRVASRTSSFYFKGKSGDIEDIARKLHVHTILEGSVRQEGNRIRIVAQLINAANGFHLWSASYNRDLSDVLLVQEEIARSIAATLVQKLNPRRAAGPRHNHIRARINPEAYTAYLQALFSRNRSGIQNNLRAIDLLNKAIRLEPDFAEAHASLATIYASLFFSGARRDTLGKAQEHATAAVRLDPDNPTALLAQVQIDECLWRWKNVDSTLRRLLREHPNNAEAHHFHAYLYIAFGRWDKAAVEEHQAAGLDPFDMGYRHSYAEALYFLHRFKEALAEYEKVLALEPNFVLSLGDLCVYSALHGHLDKAKAILNGQLIPLYPDDPDRLYCASSIAYAEHNIHQLQDLAQFGQRQYARSALSAELLAYPYAFLGDYENAMGWIEKGYDDHDFGIFCLDDPALPAELKHTVRWRAFMQRPAFHDIARVRAQILARGQ